MASNSTIYQSDHEPAQDDYSRFEDGDVSQDAPINISDEDILAAIRQDPDFIIRHGEVLSELAIAHEVGGATSLLEHQVLSLRARNVELSQQVTKAEQSAHHTLSQFIAIARSNEKQSREFYDLAVFLIESLGQGQDRSDLLDQALERVRTRFALDLVKLDIQSIDLQADAFESSSEQQLANMLRYGMPVCAPIEAAEADWLLDESEQALVASVAIVPIRGRQTQGAHGVLILGSADKARFHPNLGTHFLRDLAKLLSPLLG